MGKKVQNEQLRSIGKILQCDGIYHITCRNIKTDMMIGANKTSDFTHGIDRSVGDYTVYYSYLLDCNGMGFSPEKIIELLEEAVKKGENIVIALTDKHGNLVDGKWETVLKHEF